MITSDFLEGRSNLLDFKDLDLDMHLPSGWEKRLDLKPQVSSVAAVDISDDSDISVVAENGQVACRDYPHSRHVCVTYPFRRSPHEHYCQLEKRVDLQSKSGYRKFPFEVCFKVMLHIIGFQRFNNFLLAFSSLNSIFFIVKVIMFQYIVVECLIFNECSFLDFVKFEACFWDFVKLDAKILFFRRRYTMFYIVEYSFMLEIWSGVNV